MICESEFTFVPLTKKVSQTLTDKDNKENLFKWGLLDSLKLKFYNFNQNFKIYDKQRFVDSFFRDLSVRRSLNILEEVDRVEFITVPCTTISMKFFNKLHDEENGIVQGGYLTECPHEFVEGMLLQDNLHQMFVMEEHQARDLFDEAEKQEFIYQLFRHVCLGGKYAQHDLKLEPYLSLTRKLYSELVDVEKLAKTNELRVRSTVMRAVAYSQDRIVMPDELEHPQNFFYLIVDPFKRQVAALYHRRGGL